jgi:TolB protein
MKKLFGFAIALSGALCLLTGQDATIKVSKEAGIPAIAIPDMRGAGDAQKFMAAFNETLTADVRASGRFKIVPKTSLPTFVPQQPSDFQQPAPPPAAAPVRGSKQAPVTVVPPNGGGRWMQDWSSPPAQANHLAFGYTAAQNGVLVLQGWLYDLSKDTPANAQLIGKRYLSTVDEAGARKIAHEFAADIITLFGGQSLYGTHIYFTSDRSGHKEIWMMDPDGKNQRQITRFNNISTYPTVSPDGTKVAFTSWVKGQPAIFVFSVDPVRDLRYYNQAASVNQAGSFTPDGKQIVYASSAGTGRCCRIFIANLDGTGFRPISSSSAIEVEPKVNPKTGSDIVFSSGRSGPQQVYRMNMDGSDVERLTPGTGEASNASWHPGGQHIAFAWTQGYATGAFNIFTMNVATKDYVQLTHGDGKNENPSWAPDGIHIVFAKTRGNSSQIYTMLADGNQLQQLTTTGHNERPVWGK